MKVHRGNIHKYLGVSLDLSHKGQCQVIMHDYINGILQAYDLAIKDHDNRYQIIEKRCAKTSATPDNLFVVNEDCKKRSCPSRLHQLSTSLWQRLYMSPRELSQNQPGNCILDYASQVSRH
jgi:hypothetical protein